MQQAPQIVSPPAAAPPVVTATNISPPPSVQQLNEKVPELPAVVPEVPHEVIETREKAYNEAILHIVEEESRQKSTMPKYEGLERYSLKEIMGEGAFSVVYRALDTKTGLEVAVKAVMKQDLDDSKVC